MKKFGIKNEAIIKGITLKFKPWSANVHFRKTVIRKTKHTVVRIVNKTATQGGRSSAVVYDNVVA